MNVKLNKRVKRLIMLVIWVKEIIISSRLSKNLDHFCLKKSPQNRTAKTSCGKNSQMGSTFSLRFLNKSMSQPQSCRPHFKNIIRSPRLGMVILRHCIHRNNISFLGSRLAGGIFKTGKYNHLILSAALEGCVWSQFYFSSHSVSVFLILQHLNSRSCAVQ